jgi:hypothetical protein
MVPEYGAKPRYMKCTETRKSNQIAHLSALLMGSTRVGIPDDADQCSGDADQRFQDDGDHDSGMMPITRSGMIPIS